MKFQKDDSVLLYIDYYDHIIPVVGVVQKVYCICKSFYYDVYVQCVGLLPAVGENELEFYEGEQCEF